MTTNDPGHVFIVAGDVTQLQCDAWLLPTDPYFVVSRAFAWCVGVEPGEHLSGLSWSSEPVVEWEDGEARQGKPRIFLGNVGKAWSGGVGPSVRDGADQELSAATHVADCATAFVRVARAAIGGASRFGRPLFALPVIGTGEGGLADRKGTVQMALVNALVEASRDHEVDVALVAHGRRAYSAAQRARRSYFNQHPEAELEQFGSLTDGLRKSADDLAAHARSGNLVLFLGAGASADSGLPDWSELLLDLLKMAGAEDINLDRFKALDYRDQATVVAKLKGEETTKIYEDLRERFGTPLGTLTHSLLASLPTSEAVTTNYDELFEQAVRAIEDDSIAVLPDQVVAPGQRWLLKLHGTIDRAATIVLTRRDYLSTASTHGALFGIVQAMLMTRHMLFVGYSLEDEDFHKLVEEVRVARSDANVVDVLGSTLTLEPDPLFTKLWEDDLTIIPMAEGRSDARQRSGQVEIDRSAALQNAARRLRIFLDKVAYEAADLRAFILDDAYSDMLNESEMRLKKTLVALRDASLGSADSNGSEWDPVHDLIASYGGPLPDRTRRSSGAQ